MCRSSMYMAKDINLWWMKTENQTGRERRSDRVDRRYRVAMLITGITAAVLFMFSLVALIEFPGLFKFVAYAMVGIAILFILFSSPFSG